MVESFQLIRSLFVYRSVGSLWLPSSAVSDRSYKFAWYPAIVSCPEYGDECYSPRLISSYSSTFIKI